MFGNFYELKYLNTCKDPRSLKKTLRSSRIALRISVLMFFALLKIDFSTADIAIISASSATNFTIVIR